MLQVDLKEYYLKEVDLFNSEIPSDHEGEFSPIRTDAMVTHAALEADADAEGDEDAKYEARRDVPVLMNPRDVEQMISNHVWEAVVEFNIRVDKIAEALDADLAKKEPVALKAVNTVKADLKSTDERLQKKVEEVLVQAVDSAKKHATAGAS